MPNISRLHDFQSGEIILSSQVDGELNQLVNTVNQLPDKDGSLQTNLNADLLDGKHMSVNGGDDTIPLCDATTIQVALNADLVDGQHASDIAAAAFDIGTKIPFYQASPPSGWDEVTKPTDHIFGWKTGQAGGTTVANSWTIDGIAITIDGHALTTAELPSHTHGLNSHTHGMAHTHSVGTYDVGGSQGLKDLEVASGTGAFPVTRSGISPFDVSFDISGSSGAASSSNTDAATGNTTSTGSGAEHDHTGTVSQDGTWRPPTAYFIIGEKV